MAFVQSHFIVFFLIQLWFILFERPGELGNRGQRYLGLRYYFNCFKPFGVETLGPHGDLYI